MYKNAFISSPIVCTLIFSTLLLNVALAAPNNGVLPDGRAFRTDNNGNQVVDYIAELENQVDVLTKQVYTLEDEVSTRGCPERAAPVVNNCPACEQRACPEQVVTKEVIRNVSDQGCQHELQAIKTIAANQKVDFDVEIAKLKKELSNHLSQQGSVTSASQACAKENESLKTEVSNIRSTSDQQAQLLTALEGERNKLAAELETVRADFSKTRNALEQAELSVANTRSKSREQNQEPVVEKIAALPISAQADTRAAASSAALAGPASLSGARLRAIDSLKGSLASDINRTQSLISTRDKLFAQHRGRGAGVTIEPVEALSSNGRSIAALRQALANASSGRELSEIKAEVLEIQRKINDDLSAANRMKRLG